MSSEGPPLHAPLSPTTPVPAPDASGARTPVSATLTPDELSALLRIGRFDPAAGTPLAQLPRVEPHADTDGLLIDNGWLDRTDPPRLSADIADALHALHDGRAHVRLIMGAAEGMARLDLYRAAGGNGQRWVRWQADGAGAWANLECFYQTEAIIDRMTRALELTAGFLTPRFAVSWDWDRFQVLLGLIDVYRAASLRAILERGRSVPSSFGVEDVVEAIKQGLARPHYYWAVSLGRLLAPAEVNLSRSQIATVLEDLTDDGFVSRAGAGAWRCGRPLTEIAISLLLVPSFMSLEVTDGRGGEIRRLALVRGANTLWRASFSAQPPHRVDIAPVTGTAVIGELRQLLATVAIPPSPPGSRPDSCPQCRAEIAADSRFCKRCGTRIEAGHHVV